MIETLLREGFAYHDTESERLAGELESAVAAPVAPEHWVRLLNMVNHTVGEHLGDWPRARRIADQVLSGRTANAGTAPAWVRLATARFMAGDALGAAQAELEALRAAEDFRGAYLEAKVNLAAALIGARRADEAAALYEAALVLADPEAPSAADRSIAIASNNLATELLEVADRSETQDRLMQTAADAALRFWRKAGTWVNEERALYLQALVANALGRPDEALSVADRALAIIAGNKGDEAVDVCFLTLTRANAFAMKGETAAHAAALAAADAEAAGWDDPGLKAWYAEERAKIRLI